MPLACAHGYPQVWITENITSGLGYLPWPIYGGWRVGRCPAWRNLDSQGAFSSAAFPESATSSSRCKATVPYASRLGCRSGHRVALRRARHQATVARKRSPARGNAREPPREHAYAVTVHDFALVRGSIGRVARIFTTVSAWRKLSPSSTCSFIKVDLDSLAIDDPEGMAPPSELLAARLDDLE